MALRSVNIFAGGAWRHVLILLAVAGAIGAYQIPMTTLIVGDGASFIEYAGKLADEPGATILREEQPPGFPVILLAAQKIVSFGREVQPWSRQWIHTSQVTVLLFRLAALVLLYFVGRQLVSSREAFWAVLILSLLRKPAEYGSDVLSDWPHMFLLALGLLLLFHAVKLSCWWRFALVGLVAGLGYLIRPECLQLIACGGLWLVARLARPRGDMTRLRAACSMGAMVTACLLVVSPYMIAKGSPFPKQMPGLFGRAEQSPAKTAFDATNPTVMECSLGGDVASGLGVLANRFGNVMMWGFVPALLMGNWAFYRFRNCSNDSTPGALLASLVLMNIFILPLWFWHADYISKRHILPLVVYTIFHVPAGVKLIAQYIVRLSVKLKAKAKWRTNPEFLARLYLAMSIVPMLVALSVPIRGDKQAYRDAAEWVSANSEPAEAIVTLERRIALYAERPYKLGYRRPYFDEARYVVQVADEDEKALSDDYGELKVIKSWPMDGGGQVVVYTINGEGS